MYQLAVCNDDAAIRAQITRILDAHPQRDAFRVVEFPDSQSLLAGLRAGQSFFLLILGIELQGHNGVTVGKVLREELRDNTTQILYISASTRYAMHLFDVRPLNFLTRPLDEGKLSDCVTQALELVPKQDETLTVRSGRQARRIPLREIRYLESYNKRLTIHTTQGDCTCTQRLAQVLSVLPQPDFFQIHQSFAVNGRYVRRVRYDRLALDDGTVLSISQHFRKQVRELLFRRTPRRESCCGKEPLSGPTLHIPV